jgi:hypothetical protein
MSGYVLDASVAVTALTAPGAILVTGDERISASPRGRTYPWPKGYQSGMIAKSR